MKPMNFWLPIVCVFAMLLFLSACGPSQAELDATATEIANNIFSTQTAQAPTATTTPTDTPVPTATATPAPTLTPTDPPTPTPTVEPGAFITSTLENGWINYESREDRFSIALPPDWIQINLNPDTFDDALAVAGELNPEVGKMFTSDTIRSLLAAGMKFYALDISEENIHQDLPVSTNILKIDMGLEVPLDYYVDLNLGQIESFADPKIPINHQRVTVSDMEAEEISYGAEMVGYSGESVKMMLMQYIMLDGSVQYVITLGAPMELADSYTDIFKDIANSFQRNER